MLCNMYYETGAIEIMTYMKFRNFPFAVLVTDVNW